MRSERMDLLWWRNKHPSGTARPLFYQTTKIRIPLHFLLIGMIRQEEFHWVQLCWCCISFSWNTTNAVFRFGREWLSWRVRTFQELRLIYLEFFMFWLCYLISKHLHQAAEFKVSKQYLGLLFSPFSLLGEAVPCVNRLPLSQLGDTDSPVTHKFGTRMATAQWSLTVQRWSQRFPLIFFICPCRFHSFIAGHFVFVSWNCAVLNE